jgi:Sulfotransferase domain
MRILIVAPPKTGNSWLKCLFSSVYDLDWLTPERVPNGTSLEALAAWLAAPGFPDNAVFHHHYDYSPQLLELATRDAIHLATILRDPYDMFVSRYFFAQAPVEGEKRPGKDRERPSDVLIGKSIDDPVVLSYLAESFGAELQKGIAWLESGASVVVRYERLIEQPEAELTRATDQIQPAAPDRVRAAVAACQADNLLRTRKGLKRRIRAATSGDWRNHLLPVHLEIFREHHADRIRALGYEVR